MEIDQSVRLQRRIQFFAVAGILVTGLLVGVATAFPIYRHAHEVAARSLLDSTQGQARLLDQSLDKMTGIAAQVASRTAVRDMLEQYNAWQISLAQLVSFSAPRLRDALDQAGNIIGFVRLDREGAPVLELGEPIPPELLPPPDAAQLEGTLFGPVEIAGRPRLLVAMPILARGTDRVGTDVLSFDLAPLEAMLAESAPPGERVRQLLILGDEQWLIEVGRDDPQRLPAAMIDLLRRAASGLAGVERLRSGTGMAEVAAFSGIVDRPGWGVALVVPAEAFDSPVLERLVSPLLVMLALVLAGSVLTARAIRPVAERVLTQSRQLSQLTDGMTLAASVFESSPMAVLILDRDHRILEVNQACVDITGYGQADLRGRTLCGALCPDDERERYCGRLWQGVDQTGEWSGESRFQRSGGQSFPVWHHVSTVRDGRGVVRHYISMFSDITDKKFSEDRIRHLAHHDGLTDLPNRTLFADRLNHALERSRRDDLKVALMFIDLDRFKNVNDSLGHQYGDRLLKVVASRLQHAVRDEDTLARFGGDEFVVLVEGVRSPEGAARVAQKLLALLEDPVVLDEHEIFVGASIGIALHPDDGTDSEALLRSADSAMYEAKASGRSTFRFYTAEQTRISRELFELEGGLRRALDRGEFRVFFQPQADCRSGELIGAEALVRWLHPERGLVPPDQFIPVAEEIGLIGQIGNWVLEIACAQARKWELAGKPIRVAVNLSSQQVGHRDLYQVVGAILQRTGLSPRLLELEITEGHILRQVEQCIINLEHLKTLGITLAIDDFGTGYSSLSYLKRLPVDRLKIDRSFVEGLPDDLDDAAIVGTILSMASFLGKDVIAEGVETPAQLGYLVQRECREYQGYLLGRPMPAEVFEAWMAEHACA